MAGCRLGSFEVTEAEGVQRGTKVVIHLKGECYDYAKEETIKGDALLEIEDKLGSNNQL